jgi:AmmeMemoRadiSam system protein A
VNIAAKWLLKNTLNQKKAYIKQEDGYLSEEQGKFLLKVAREAIEAELFGKGLKRRSLDKLPEIFKKSGAVFVTITKRGQLRGCIGHIIAHEPLIRSVEDNAIAAAFEDPRFFPLSKEEFKDIKIEISVLTEPKPLEYKDAKDLLNKLRPGIDGVIIKRGPYTATFLPQVWEQLPEKELFLSHLCLKAGLPSDEWKRGDLEVFIYQVQAFEEK